MDALFDEIDLGTYMCMCTVFDVHVCICMCVQILVDGKYMYVLEKLRERAGRRGRVGVWWPGRAPLPYITPSSQLAHF